MAKYSTRPIEIDAVQFNTAPTSVDPTLTVFFAESPQWLEDAEEIVTFEPGGDGNWHCFIATLEGTAEVASQDWIVQEGQRLYPCKPDIFEQTYEAV